MRPSFVTTLFSCALALTAFAVAAEPPPIAQTAPPAPAAPTAVGRAPLDRVVLLGASATAGFRARIDVPYDKGVTRVDPDFGDVLSATIRRPGTVVSTHSDLFFFSNPMAIGARLVELTLRDAPTLVVGIDFVFWYGYGTRDRTGNGIDGPAARLDLLDEGLKQLDRFECPVFVGDFPDMSAAVGRMLSAAQMPKADTLDALNRRLREWAGEKSNVTVVPLAQLSRDMRMDKGFAIGERQWPAGSTASLLQRDRLHPTADGLVTMGRLVAEIAITGSLAIAADEFELDPAVVRDRLEKVARAKVRARAAGLRPGEAAPPAGSPDGTKIPSRP